jgi:hypothetical protein
MKLNPEKCTFSVPAGQLLGYIVSQRGIEANPSKIKAIGALEPSTKLKDVQKFVGCLASLSRFISRLREKAMPLYQLMKKIDHFVWSHSLDWQPASSTEPQPASPNSRIPVSRMSTSCGTGPEPNLPPRLRIAGWVGAGRPHT